MKGDSKKEIIEFMKALGFKETSSKNAYMLSFFPEESDDDPRINIYFTRMTIQIQYKNGQSRYAYNVSLSELESILDKIILRVL